MLTTLKKKKSQKISWPKIFQGCEVRMNTVGAMPSKVNGLLSRSCKSQQAAVFQ